MHWIEGSASRGSLKLLELSKSINTYKEANQEDEMYRLHQMMSLNTHGMVTTLGGGGNTSTVTSAITYASSAGGSSSSRGGHCCSTGPPSLPKQMDMDSSTSMQSALSGVHMDDNSHPIPPSS